MKFVIYTTRTFLKASLLQRKTPVRVQDHDLAALFKVNASHPWTRTWVALTTMLQGLRFQLRRPAALTLTHRLRRVSRAAMG